ncbi:MAG: hypothetical protein KDD53_12735, partial [Bdellovibrionales bacterium]|nr:hypothetical protein [Bdellovibrionales bacterium]
MALPAKNRSEIYNDIDPSQDHATRDLRGSKRYLSGFTKHLTLLNLISLALTLIYGWYFVKSVQPYW